MTAQPNMRELEDRLLEEVFQAGLAAVSDKTRAHAIRIRAERAEEAKRRADSHRYFERDLMAHIEIVRNRASGNNKRSVMVAAATAADEWRAYYNLLASYDHEMKAIADRVWNGDTKENSL